jgi:hypothetical protein
MQNTYYIDLNGIKDGPHNLVNIMRRIRTGKVGPDTLIHVGDSPTSIPAKQIEEISHFFTREKAPETPALAAAQAPLSISRLIGNSWQFTIEHNIMTVYAGLLVLLNAMASMWLVNNLGYLQGGVLAWIFCVTCHNFYLVFMLRLYRGQTFSSDFFNNRLQPILGTLFLSCIILALMMVGGLVLLVLPLMIVSVYYIFVPFLILDHKYKMVEAMHASRLLLQKNNQQYLRLVVILILTHYICMTMIVPLPLTLPMFTAALAELYEKISNS